MTIFCVSHCVLFRQLSDGIRLSYQEQGVGSYVLLLTAKHNSLISYASLVIL